MELLPTPQPAEDEAVLMGDDAKDEGEDGIEGVLELPSDAERGEGCGEVPTAAAVVTPRVSALVSKCSAPVLALT
jgi:hypothetical protein